MIFPDQLRYVSLYLPETEKYYELVVSGAQSQFSVEPFYNREAISAKKNLKFAGFRFSMDFTFDQTLSHSAILEFFNDLYSGDPSQLIRLYLRPESEIDEYKSYFTVAVDNFLSKSSYRNTISRHGYEMSFTGRSRDFGIGLAYLVTYSDIPYLNYDNQPYLVRLNPY